MLTCDSSSPLPRPPFASSYERLIKSAHCRQPSCNAGMLCSWLLIQCFAYCVLNATCFYMFNVNKGKKLSDQNEVFLIWVISYTAGYQVHCEGPAGIFLHSFQPSPFESHLSSFSNYFPLAEISVLLSSARCSPAWASTWSAAGTGIIRTETPYVCHGDKQRGPGRFRVLNKEEK